MLSSIVRTQRQQHDSAVGKLIDERLRNGFRGCRHDDAIKGPPAGCARKAISDQHFDIVVAESCKVAPRRVSESPEPLDRHHFARQPRQNGCLISRAGADFEHAMLGTNGELFRHVGDDKRLADRLAAGDRQGLVGVGRVHEPARHEVIAGDFIQRPQHTRIDYPAPAQVEQELHATDAVVTGWWSGHGRPMVYTLDGILRNTGFLDTTLLESMGTNSRSGGSPAAKRILVVEDEVMIRMLLEDMLDELGYTVAAEAAHLDEALEVAKTAEFDIAILDVDLNGKSITPVAELLATRGMPFVFTTGYGVHGLPDAYRDRPVLKKPYQINGLGQILERTLNGAG
jgi:CheY-like chemotaxis protein